MKSRETKTSSLERFAKERAQFRALLLANPNYFGNVKASPFKPVLQIAANTTYEEIGCVGFRPESNRLEAVVYVKQPTGYGGGICSSGTPEYVRFYMEAAGGWQDLGMASFTAYNIPEGTEEEKRLEYACGLTISPRLRFCFINNLPKVRAILSWNAPPPPDEPDFIPVWGEVHNTVIKIAGIKLIPIADLLAEAKVKLPDPIQQVIDLDQPVVTAAPKKLTALELKDLYRGKKIEKHRFALEELQQVISQPAASAALQSSGFAGLFPGLELNVDDLAPLFPIDGNTSYEELECVGFNPLTETLTGIIRVKLSAGYSGGPCTAGSTEYVTFWADFNNNGTFETCLGTASVQVHDISGIPKDGLEYAVFLPVDLTHHKQPCESGAKVVRIRAILSWNVPPPCANSNYVPVWGNREETLIHIYPGPVVPPGSAIPVMSIIGGVPVSKIDDLSGVTTPDAIFALNGLPPDALGRPCPFGGRVVVQGPQYVGFKYRIQVREVGTLAWSTVTTPLKVTDLIGNVNDQLPDGAGLFTYLPFTQNIANVLAWWDSPDDDLWEIRLQIFTLGNVLLPGVDTHRVQLDNKGPDAHIQIDTGAGDCGKFPVGTDLSGRFVARDTWFGSFSLSVLPAINDPGEGVPSPSSGTVQTAVAPGDPWTLDTDGMQACGYVIRVDVVDRAIVNSSGPGSVHHNADAAGFCLEEA
jgi:hypothetical protein